jgi:hypothetical protein
MCSGKGDWALPQPGFPIRTSPDHSSVGSSPRLFAASYVLHRFLMPRHPPCALNNLPQIPLVFLMTKSLKMLASTMQFSTFGRVPPLVRRLPDIRCRGRVVRRQDGPAGRIRPEETYPFPQDPTVCLANPCGRLSFHSGKPVVLEMRALRLAHVNVPPLSFPLPNTRRQRALGAFRRLDAP